MFTSIISALQLNNIISDPQLIIFDCRYALSDALAGQKAYEASHIKRAVHLNLDRDLSGVIIVGKTGRHPLPPLDIMVKRFSQWGIDKEKQIVVYDDKKGAIAARLWWMLRYAGHDNVAVLDGGWQAWEQAGLACETSVNKLTPSLFHSQPKPAWVLDADQVKSLEKNKQWAIVDARSAERYRGEVEPIDPVAGHIPGAINRPFAGNWTAEGLMKSPEELKRRFADLPPASQCVFYCGSGVTACYNILAFARAELGIPRLYPGSWSEWITDDSRKVVNNSKE